MEVNGEHQFKAPRSAVWAAMLDPQSLKSAMPGVEAFTETAPGAYDLTIKVGIAAIKGTYSGNVKVVEPTPESSYRLVVAGKGSPGSVQGDALMTLTENAAGTLVTYSGEVKAQGAIARMGSRLLGGAAKLMIGQFMKGMEKQIESRTA